MEYTIGELVNLEEQIELKIIRQKNRINTMIRRRGESTIRERFTQDGKITELVQTEEERKSRKAFKNSDMYKSEVILLNELEASLRKISVFWREHLYDFNSTNIKIVKK